MQQITTYCHAVALMETENVHKIYHDNEYGFPLDDDNELFGRLILEINQAGLSWTTILKKKENFFNAYDGFDVFKVSQYGEKDFARLLNDAGIIRNRLKINAAIENAKKIIAIKEETGSFKKWLDGRHPLTKEEWVKIFKKTFKFTGGEIVNEFLMSAGYLPGAHIKECPVYKNVLAAKPMWLVKKK